MHPCPQFFFLKYVDPATYQILGNLKIVTTGLLLRLALKRYLSRLQVGGWAGGRCMPLHENPVMTVGCCRLAICCRLLLCGSTMRDMRPAVVDAAAACPAASVPLLPGCSLIQT